MNTIYLRSTQQFYKSVFSNLKVCTQESPGKLVKMQTPIQWARDSTLENKLPVDAYASSSHTIL